MSKRVSLWFAVVVLLVGSCGASARAQNVTGTIQGTVFDAKGGVIPNVAISVTNQDQNLVIRTMMTDERGQYVAAQLPVGKYRVTAVMEGFKKVVRSGI